MGRVVVVGSANVDLVWHGPRLPAPGETVTGGRFVEVLGGKGANQAAAAAALGADVHFVGCVGDDGHGRAVRADLAARGIDCTFVAESTEPTGIALIMVDSAGENAIAVAPGANRMLAPHAARAAVEAIAGRRDVVLCSFEVPLDAVLEAVKAADAAQALGVVNPAPFRELAPGVLEGLATAALVLTPNELEAAGYGGAAALSSYGADVVVTLGPRGAELHRSNEPPRPYPGFAVDTVDTTGAGDAFNGTLAWALADGRTLEDAIPLACAAGALATRAIGARGALPTAQEVYALAAT